MTIAAKTLAFFTLITSAIAAGFGVQQPVHPHKTVTHAAAVSAPTSNGLEDVLFAADAHLDPPAPPAEPASQDAAPPDAAAPQDAAAPPDNSAPPAPAAVVSAPVRQPVAAPPPAPAPPPATPAPPQFVVGSTQQALINQDRAAAGLPPLNWSPCLASIAAGQAQAMANAGYIFHGSGVQQDWGCRLGSSQTGENVGVWGAGINDAGINQLFLGSAPHRANIMGPYHWVGTAWVIGAGNKGYIAVEFA